MIQLLQQLNKTIIPHRKTIISLFVTGEWLIVLLTAVGVYMIYTGSPQSVTWYELGAQAGKVALYVFFVTISAGILRRFGLLQPIQQLLMLFRRHLGITTYLLGVMHWSLVRLVFSARQGTLANTPPLFEFVSFVAMQIMFVMFVTSNDWSVKHLGAWWKRIHKLIYVVAWLLFFHVALQPGEARENAPIALFFAVAEVVSLIYFWNKQRLKREQAPPDADVSANVIQ